GERITGYSRHELNGTHIGKLLSAKDLELVDELRKRALEGKRSRTAEIEIIGKDGSKRSLELNGQLITENAVPVGFEGIARDITERRDLEQQLLQAQKMEAVGRFA